MRTLVFCTAHATSAPVWQTRYRRWLDAVLAGGLEAAQILLVDDGSASLPGWADTDIFTGSVAGEAFTTGPRGKILLFHFKERLGRRGVMDFPGWHRSFVFAALYAQANGFDRVIHIESDAYVISDRARDFLTGYQDGWASLWSPRYGMAETAIQVAAGTGLQALGEFARQPYAALIGKSHEKHLPFTHYERGLTGDRYGEDSDHIPFDADYAAQVPGLKDPGFYWWLNGRQAALPVTSTLLQFRENGADIGALAAGWAEPEIRYHWMVGSESVVRLPGLKGSGAGRLQLRLVPHVMDEKLPRQRLILELNGSRLGEFDIEIETTLAVAVPASLLRQNGQNVLRLVHPDAAVPSVLNPALTDTRRIALSVDWIKAERW